MAKLDPSSLKRPDVVRETKTFTDPMQPGKSFDLTFEACADFGLETSVAAKAREFTRDYVTGRNGGPPAPLMPVGKRDVLIDADICARIATFMVMEKPPEGDEPWDFNQWRVLSATMPSAFADIAEWCDELIIRARAEVPNE